MRHVGNKVLLLCDYRAEVISKSFWLEFLDVLWICFIKLYTRSNPIYGTFSEQSDGHLDLYYSPSFPTQLSIWNVMLMNSHDRVIQKFLKQDTEKVDTFSLFPEWVFQWLRDQWKSTLKNSETVQTKLLSHVLLFKFNIRVSSAMFPFRHWGICGSKWKFNEARGFCSLNILNINIRSLEQISEVGISSWHKIINRMI